MGLQWRVDFPPRRWLAGVLGARPIFLVAAALCGTALAACGSEPLPDGTVARVGSATVERSQFERWVAVASRPASGAAAAVFDPPRFRRCALVTARALRKRVRAGTAVPGAEQLRGLCERSYRRLRARVMRAVVGASWMEGEARRRGIPVSDVEVRRRVLLARRGRAPGTQSDPGFRLAWSGLFAVDQAYWVRMTLLAEKLHARVLRGAGTPSRAEVAAYYRAHRSQYALSPRRDVLVVEASTRDRAEAARRALEAGESFSAVAPRWSIDRTTNRRGGRLVAIQRGLRGPGFDRAVFSARKGVLVGPVSTPLGFAVVKVTAIHRANRRMLAQARPSIRRLLTRQRRDAAWVRFLRDFSKRWQARTRCAKEFVVPECKRTG